MLDNVCFFLDTTGSSFQNHEVIHTFWTFFHQDSRGALAGDHRKETAEYTLKIGIRQLKETVTCLSKDVIRVLRRGYQTRWQKGTPTSLCEGERGYLKHAYSQFTNTERAASSRSRHRQRLLESSTQETNRVFPTAVGNSLRQAMCDIFVEELWKLHPQSATSTTLASLGDTVRKEVQQARGCAPGSRSPSGPPPVSYVTDNQGPVSWSRPLAPRHAPKS